MASDQSGAANPADLPLDEDECLSAMDVDFDNFLRQLGGEVRREMCLLKGR
jgi:hypothetical protein